MQGLHSFNFVTGGLLILMSFSDSFNLASGGFLAAPPLIKSKDVIAIKVKIMIISGVGKWKGIMMKKGYKMTF